MATLVYYAPDRARSKRPFPMDSNATTLAAVSLIADDGGLLDQAGWSKNAGGSSYAMADIYCPLGFELTSNFCMVDGAVYQIVPSGGSIAEAGPGGPVTVPQVLNFDLSLNEAATAANLALAITTFSQFNAVAAGAGTSWNMELTAKNPGPGANLSDIEGYGAVTSAAGPSGGAWQWLSQTNPVGSQIGILLSAAGYSSANLCIEQQYIGIPASGPTPVYTTTYYLAFRAQWQFRADSYSLAFWVAPDEDEGLHAGDGNGDNNFYYGGVPRHCEVTFGAEPTGGVSSAFAYWGTRAAFNSPGNGASLFMGDFVTGNPSGGGFSLAAPVSNGMPNCGKDGGPLIVEAHFGLPYTTGEMKLVGWLYDAIIVCDQYPLDSGPASPDGTYVSYDGHQWVAMLAQAGATLFLCWE
jgi:hypothetical protein